MKSLRSHIYCLVIGLLVSNFIYGQIDTINLSGLTVTTTLPKNNNSKIEKIGQLNSALIQQKNLYLKEYTPGGITSISVRGNNPSHSKVFVDGFLLNSSFHGQMDLSLLPNYFIESASLNLYRNNLSSFALGGTFHFNLNDKKFKKNNLEVFLKSGSFGLFEIGGKINTRITKKLTYQAKINYLSSKNNYPFKYEGEKYFLKNAQINKKNLSQSLSWKINQSNKVSVSLWNSHMNRGIPNAASAINSPIENNQTDKSNRISLKYLRTKKNHSLEVKSGYFYELIDYTNLISELRTTTNEISFTWYKNSFSINPILSTRIYTAESNGYQTTQNREAVLFGLNSSYQLNQSNKFYLSLQKEYVSDKNWQTFSPNFVYNHLSKKNLELSFNISKSYRYPNLNDLYWQEGGNIDLESEKTNNIALGIKQSLNISNYKFIPSLNIYCATIKNYIQWTPNSEGLWSPENLSKVENSGLELGLKHILARNKISIQQEVLYSYTKSINKGNAKRQLIYIPLHQVAVNQSVSLKKITLHLQNKIVGKRFITSDNLSNLNPYWIMNLSANYLINIKKQKINLGLELNNIFNEQYQTIAQRPMPGFNFALSLKYSIHE